MWPQSEVIEDDSHVEAVGTGISQRAARRPQMYDGVPPSMHHQAAKRAADAVEAASSIPSSGQHACAFYTRPKAARAALQALLFTEPVGDAVGEAGVVLQRRSLKGQAVGSGAVSCATWQLANLQWKLKRRGEYENRRGALGARRRAARAGSSRSVLRRKWPRSTCKVRRGHVPVVRSVPGSQAWTDAKVCAASILRGLNHAPGNQLTAIACDCDQDEGGPLVRAADQRYQRYLDRNEVWMPRKKIIVSKEEPLQRWNVKAPYCDQQIPEDAYTSTRTPWRAT